MSTVIHEVTPNESWLKCRLDKGMFSDELAITYPSEGTPQKSVFVPMSVVQKIGEHIGRVRVRIVVRGMNKLAVLPSANGDIVSVIQDQDISSE